MGAGPWKSSLEPLTLCPLRPGPGLMGVSGRGGEGGSQQLYVPSPLILSLWPKRERRKTGWVAPPPLLGVTLKQEQGTLRQRDRQAPCLQPPPCIRPRGQRAAGAPLRWRVSAFPPAECPASRWPGSRLRCHQVREDVGMAGKIGSRSGAGRHPGPGPSRILPTSCPCPARRSHGACRCHATGHRDMLEQVWGADLGGSPRGETERCLSWTGLWLVRRRPGPCQAADILRLRPHRSPNFFNDFFFLKYVSWLPQGHCQEPREGFPSRSCPRAPGGSRARRVQGFPSSRRREAGAQAGVCCWALPLTSRLAWGKATPLSLSFPTVRRCWCKSRMRSTKPREGLSTVPGTSDSSSPGFTSVSEEVRAGNTLVLQPSIPPRKTGIQEGETSWAPSPGPAVTPDVYLPRGPRASDLAPTPVFAWPRLDPWLLSACLAHSSSPMHTVAPRLQWDVAQDRPHPHRVSGVRLSLSLCPEGSRRITSHFGP